MSTILGIISFQQTILKPLVARVWKIQRCVTAEQVSVALYTFLKPIHRCVHIALPFLPILEKTKNLRQAQNMKSFMIYFGQKLSRIIFIHSVKPCFFLFFQRTCYAYRTVFSLYLQYIIHIMLVSSGLLVHWSFRTKYYSE